MLKAVLFDMDGVIVNSEPLHYKAYHEMYKEIGINITPTLHKSFTGKATLPICKELCEQFNLSIKPEALVSIKRKYFYRFFDNDPDFKLIDGVFDLINHYHKNKLKLILASSASMPNIEKNFNRFDLDCFFDAKISGAELKASKPHPEIFINAAKASGFSKKECMVIEDSTNGMKAAKEAGIFCVAYDSVYSINQDYSLANLVIKDFKEIQLPLISHFFN
jgi:HAD superfamily hydrolase (TIGR01509 family)